MLGFMGACSVAAFGCWNSALKTLTAIPRTMAKERAEKISFFIKCLLPTNLLLKLTQFLLHDRGSERLEDAFLQDRVLSFLTQNVFQELPHLGIERLAGRSVQVNVDHAAQGILLINHFLESPRDVRSALLL